MAASLTSSRSVDEIHNLLLCGACKKTINEPKICLALIHSAKPVLITWRHKTKETLMAKARS
jgi:hypothetical protein